MDTLRTFIAIELGPAMLGQLGDLQARMREDVPPGLVRWVRPQGIHLTLKFLGDVPAPQVEAIADALGVACASYAPFTAHVGGLGCFPNPRRPRVIWVGVDEESGALANLQRDVERAMAQLGHPAERRKFSPHLTLGRVKRGSAADVQALGEYVVRASVTVGKLEATAVHLMRSELLPAGAVYSELAVAPLMAEPDR
jgi:2'-5' RNA ligase